MTYFGSILKSSSAAWAVAGAAILTGVALAGRIPRSGSKPTSVEIFKLSHSPADRLAAIKQHPKFKQGLLAAHRSVLLAKSELDKKLKPAGITLGGSGSITLTPGHPSQTLPGLASPTGCLVISAPTLSILDDTGWIEVPSQDGATAPAALTVMFTPSTIQKPYMIEVDLNELGGASALFVSQLGGLSASVPIEGNGHSAQFVLVPADTNTVSINVWPDHGEIAITAIKITGF